jgi:hypothetical protein
MKDKKTKPLVMCHLALMAILGIINIASVVVLCQAALTSTFDTTAKSPIYFMACSGIFNTLAMCLGMVYILKGCSKQAAGFYKAFIACTAFSLIGGILSNLFSILSGNQLIASNAVSAFRLVVLLAVFVLLLILAFAKDLGKRRTWIIYYIILALTIILIFPGLTGSATNGKYDVGLAVAFHISAIILIGTIGLAIRGKYADKDARETTGNG